MSQPIKLKFAIQGAIARITLDRPEKLNALDPEMLSDLGGDSTINQVVIDAGKTLALRFQPKGQYLRSFVSQESWARGQT